MFFAKLDASIATLRGFIAFFNFIYSRLDSFIYLCCKVIERFIFKRLP